MSFPKEENSRNSTVRAYYFASSKCSFHGRSKEKLNDDAIEMRNAIFLLKVDVSAR